jgi:hypothetical protein
MSAWLVLAFCAAAVAVIYATSRWPLVGLLIFVGATFAAFWILTSQGHRLQRTQDDLSDAQTQIAGLVAEVQAAVDHNTRTTCALGRIHPAPQVPRESGRAYKHRLHSYGPALRLLRGVDCRAVLHPQFTRGGGPRSSPQTGSQLPGGTGRSRAPAPVTPSPSRNPGNGQVSPGRGTQGQGPRGLLKKRSAP